MQRRLVVWITLLLLASLLVGAALSYRHAVTKVRTEMAASLAVGRHLAARAVDDKDGSGDPAHRLAQIVSNFDGDRHLRAVLRDRGGALLAVSVLQQATDPAPHPLFDLLADSATRADVKLPPALAAAGTLTLETDSHNEVAEAWDDLKLGLATLGLFFALTLSLMIWTVRSAVLPLRELSEALARIGAGFYEARVVSHNYRELAPVQDRFNEMAARLAAMEARNCVLEEQLQRVQEEERAELARDLHDEVAPFLFTVGADAAVARQLLQSRGFDSIAARLDNISESTRHMQKHLKTILSRLMPNAVLGFGLPSAIESLVDFWRARRPDIEFEVAVTDAPLDDKVRAAIFRVVQESLSNAIRHGGPTLITIDVRNLGTEISVHVADNGSGLVSAQGAQGFGLLGMRERVRSVGGNLRIADRSQARGVSVHASLPCAVSPS